MFLTVKPTKTLCVCAYIYIWTHSLYIYQCCRYRVGEYIAEDLEKQLIGNIRNYQKMSAKINLDVKNYENIGQIGNTKNSGEIGNVRRYFQHTDTHLYMS